MLIHFKLAMYKSIIIKTLIDLMSFEPLLNLSLQQGTVAAVFKVHSPIESAVCLNPQNIEPEIV